MKRLKKLWLEVRILWARLCGWKVIREDIYADRNPLVVGPREKVWVLGNIYGPGYGPEDCLQA
jgi:hypothetical protein